MLAKIFVVGICMPANLCTKRSLFPSRFNSVHATAVMEPCWQKAFNLYVSNTVGLTIKYLARNLNSSTPLCNLQSVVIGGY